MKRLFYFLLPICSFLFLTLTACNIPRVTAESRLFLDLSLELLGEVELPEFDYQGTKVGGLSGLTFDRTNNRFYAISDDRSNFAPARFYTIDLPLEKKTFLPQIPKVENVTLLKNIEGENYPPGGIDSEGIVLSPRGTVFISSEGSAEHKINPFVAEFDLKTGQLRQELNLPKYFLPQTPILREDIPHGVRDNLGFEALTLSIISVAPEDPFRLFTAPESSLVQDTDETNPQERSPIRLLHYLINPIGPPLMVSENLYHLDPNPEGAISNGLTDLVALDREGFLLSLERTYGSEGSGAKIFQVVTGNATDTSRIASLRSNSNQVQPVKKQLLLDLSTLAIPLDNLEGMTLGPRLPNGDRTLILVSDNNFRQEQITQFIVFRLTEKP